MIEINLLRPRIKPPGWQAPLEPRGWSAFISRRELVLAIVFLALSFAVLRVGFGLFDLEATVMGDQTSSVPPHPPPSEDFLPDAQSQTESLAEASALAREAGTVADPTVDSPLVGPPPLPSSPSTPANPPPGPAASPQGSPNAEPPLGESLASPSGGELMQLRRVTQGSLVQVVVLANGSPTYNTFQVDNPNRVVIDIPGFHVEIPTDQRSQAITHPSIKRVRVGQYQDNPPVSRLVFDVVSFPDVEISSQPGSLRIRLSPAVE